MAALRFLVLLAIKVVSRVFYRFEVEWVGHKPRHPFDKVGIFLLLNHTSLFEPILCGAVPMGFMWHAAQRGLLPGADSTLNRPIAGRFFKILLPNVVAVTRNRDKSWRDFIDHVKDDTIVLMSPEGRMKRRDGLDKHGKPMTMRGGIVDILEKKKHGTLMLMYSEGLHHVQAPGEGFPNLFQTVRMRFEEIPIEEYKRHLHHGSEHFRTNVMRDLERRRDAHCPWN
jgi:hypothetical protein